MEGTDFNEVIKTVVGLGKTITQLEKEKEIPQAYTLDGALYVTRDIKRLKKPTPEPLMVSTLTGLVDYLTANVDELTQKDLLCHVVSPICVEVCSKLFGDFHQRKVFVVAEANHVPRVMLDSFMDVEAFNIMLMSCFVDDADRARVLAISGNVVADTEVQALDDGVSQEASVKTGIRKKENAEVPNPVILKPFRTFTDIPQPSGKFVFRLKQTEHGIRCALFDATGGAWKGEAMDSIKSYLQRELAADPDGPAAQIRVIA